LGGGYPGDQSYNALFANRGNKHHWLKVKLVGTKANRSALGARIKVDLTGADGVARSFYRWWLLVSSFELVDVPVSLNVDWSS
jgi:hypothetical protein